MDSYSHDEDYVFVAAVNQDSNPPALTPNTVSNSATGGDNSGDDFVLVDAAPNPDLVDTRPEADRVPTDESEEAGLEMIFKELITNGVFQGRLAAAELEKITNKLTVTYGFSQPFAMTHVPGPHGPVPADFLVFAILREWSRARDGRADYAYPDFVALKSMQFDGEVGTGAFVGFFQDPSAPTTWTLIHQAHSINLSSNVYYSPESFL